MLTLRCSAQNYEWGKDAASSEVAQLARANGAQIDESKPFAELWMGTHPNCPSLVAASSTSLQQWIEQHPECLGPEVRRRFGTNLPFLLKILSVNKALSIQSHPDKQLAERLHMEQPKLYPDGNHKPEMALALSEFDALCGFCPMEELQAALREVPELAECVGEPHTSALLAAREADAQALKAGFTALMTCEPARVQQAVQQLVQRLQQEQQEQQQGGSTADQRTGLAGRLAQKEALALRLNYEFPGDVGVLSCFFFNLMRLQPGQALFLPANVPHAYLKGDNVECMAASDNVIRAGLTPKFKDTAVLCSSLSYEQGVPEILEGAITDSTAANVNNITAASATAASGKQAAEAAGTAAVLAVGGSGGAGAAAGAQAESTAAGASEVAVAGVATRGSEAAVESEAAGGSDAPGGKKAVGGEGAVGVSAEARVRLYQPACEEFEVQSIEVPSGTTLTLPPSPGPSLLLVQHGQGRAEGRASISNAPELQSEVQLSRGCVLFIPAGTTPTLTCSGDGPLRIWVAAVNSTLLHLGDSLRRGDGHGEQGQGQGHVEQGQGQGARAGGEVAENGRAVASTNGVASH